MRYYFRDCGLDDERRELHRSGQRVQLEPKVYQVLLYFLQHPDRVISKDELLDQCWPDMFVSDSALMQCLSRLRQAIQPDRKGPPVLKTVHRQGYRLMVEVTTSVDDSPAIEPDAAERRHEVQPLQNALPLASPAPHHAETTTVPPQTLEPLAFAESSTSTAERRQLTVMCCHIVETTSLAGELDPEDFHDVMHQYLTTCIDIVETYGGYIAQSTVDLLLVYFSYPQAHEDDAQRAAHAGLEIIAALDASQARLTTTYGMQLAVRIGVHTGFVVIGASGNPSQQSPFTTGPTLHLGTILQTLAAPNTMVLSADTYHLVQDYFLCEPAGEHTQAGLAEPRRIYRVLQPSRAQSRLDATLPQGHSQFVGREMEYALLRERWAQTKQGRGQAVLLSGEPGIGKSRLIQEIKSVCGADAHTLIEYRGSPYHQHTALHPVIEWLRQLPRGDAAESGPLTHIERLLQQMQLNLDESLPYLATLLELDLPTDRDLPRQLPLDQQRQRTLEILLALVLARAESQPVLLVVEDLHWMDPTTLEWLGLLLAQGPTAPIFALMTCRPTFQPPWSGRAHVMPLALQRLDTPQVEQMIQGLAGYTLPAELLQHVVSHTDGIPLFIEEVTKFLLASGALPITSDVLELTLAPTTVNIPSTLQDLLMARLDQLGESKGTAQLGATIGREFSAALLRAVTPLDADRLQHDLTQLVEADLLYQRGVGAQAVFLFKHALVQETAYASLLRRTRQRYHQHIVHALETQFADSVTAQPELLAHHHTEAGHHDLAVAYWQRAGQLAIKRSAIAEAVTHLTRGHQLLSRLPDTPDGKQCALSLHVALGAALIMAQGHAAPAVERTYAQAYALCQQVEQTPELAPVLLGLWRFYLVRANLQRAQALAEQLLRLAQGHLEPSQHVLAQYAAGVTRFWRGDLSQARRDLEAGTTHYHPDQHHALAFHAGQDPGVACLAFGARTLWLLGYPDQALQRAQEAVQEAERLAHPFSQAFALTFLGYVYQFRRSWESVHVHAEAVIDLSAQQGFPFWAALATCQRGWALAAQGKLEAGLSHLRQGFDAWQAIGGGLGIPHFLSVLATLEGQRGAPSHGLHLLDQAVTHIEKADERWWEAEIYRLKGDLLRQDPLAEREQAEAWLRQALDLARRQQAKSLELRVAMSLSRLWQQHGQPGPARELIAAVYAGFTEGFDTPDLQEAQTLLASLS